LRFGRQASCPRCGGEVLDLGGESGQLARRTSRKTLAARFWSLVPTPSSGFGLVGVPFIIIYVLFVYMEDLPERPARWLARRRSKTHSRVAVMSLQEPEEANDDGERVEVEGHVEIVEPIRAPVSGEPCAAFRIVGRCGRDPVDDGCVGSFEVVGDDGERAVIRGTEGTLDVPVEEAVDVVPDDALSEYLRQRGLQWEGSVTLAEGIVRDGDRIVVEGVATSRSRAEGYRGTTTVLEMVDVEGSPLWICAP
jgi:hypothetical protein